MAKKFNLHTPWEKESFRSFKRLLEETSRAYRRLITHPAQGEIFIGRDRDAYGGFVKDSYSPEAEGRIIEMVKRWKMVERGPEFNVHISKLPKIASRFSDFETLSTVKEFWEDVMFRELNE